MGKIAREQFDRRIRNLNTRMRSLEFDRDQLHKELELKRIELDNARRDIQEARSQDRELVVVFGQDDGTELAHIGTKTPKVRPAAVEPNGASERPSVEKRIEPDKPADHPRRRTPKKVPIEVEEPDAVVSPDLEYPPVRFG